MQKRTITKTPAKKAPANNGPITDRAEISSTTPIPFEGGMGFSWVNNRSYLPFLSPDDNYGQLLLESRLLSATHNACIITKKDYCAGTGFRHIDGTELNKDFKTWLNSINLKDESATDISRQAFEGLFTFGNVPIELVRFTVGTKKQFYVYVHNFLEWKLGEPDENDIAWYALQSKLFLQTKVVLTEDDHKKFKSLPLYNPRWKDQSKSKATHGYNWVKFPDGTERSLIWYKNPVSGFQHYGLPSAVSGLIYQILEYKGARYNLDNFENNMVVSAILALKGSVSQKEADRIGKKAIVSHTGDGKRGRVIVVASEDGIDSSDMHSFDTHKEGSFVEAEMTWSQKILLANQWDAVLAGIMSPSTLGKGTGFITKILEIKKNTVIRPAQKDAMERIWEKVFKIANDWMGFGVDPNNVEIEDAVDISGLTDVDITPTVTVDEVRNAKGMSELEDKKKGKMLLGELGNEQKKGVYVKDTKTKTEKIEE